MRHWIFGPGAVGHFFANRMEGCHAKHRPILIGRGDSLPADGPPDAIWIATPAWAVATVLGREDLPKSVPILITSNGLGVYETAMKSIAAAKGNSIHRAALWLGVSLDPSTRSVIENGVDHVEIAPYHPIFHETLGKIGVPCKVAADPIHLEWRKALTNLVINPICALADRENGAILTDPALHARAKRVLEECVEVARALGISLTSLDEAQVWNTAERTAQNRNSMLQAKNAGKRTEIEFLTARLVALGREIGIATPESEKTLSEFLMTQLR